jgi:hypothetical protein
MKEENRNREGIKKQRGNAKIETRQKKKEIKKIKEKWKIILVHAVRSYSESTGKAAFLFNLGTT